MPWRSTAASLTFLLLAAAPSAQAAKPPEAVPWRSSNLHKRARYCALPGTVRFKTADGWTVAALYRAPKPGRDAVVLVHGLGSSSNEWWRLIPRLHAMGLGTLAIDLRGHGKSLEGPRGRTLWMSFDAAGEWPKAVQDVLAAVRFLGRRGIPDSRVALMGASIGANLVSQAAARLPKTPWVVLLSPGRDYHGVGVASLDWSRDLAAASFTDPYAYMTCIDLSRAPHGPRFLTAESGHGVEMFQDKRFMAELLSWIRSRAFK